MVWIDLAGAAASVVGLGASFWAVLAASGAKKAAEKAATNALASARRRDLVEELANAEHKLQELGVFVEQEEWVGVRIRTAEILAICRSAMTRWSDDLIEDRKNDVLTAGQLVHSIATKSAEISGNAQISAADKKRLVATHLKASGLLNDALGEARRTNERNGDAHAN
jgi:hypothetical protein